MPLGQTYDAIVIGAGPAGSAAALLLARQGVQVLLVDKSEFPRQKVCGSCFNQLSLQLLESFGLAPALKSLAVELRRFHLRTASSHLNLSLEKSVAVSRASLDNAIVEYGKNCGVEFLDNCSARVEFDTQDEFRIVQLRLNDEHAHVKARLVIVADGLAGRALEKFPGLTPHIERGSRVGAGVIIDTAPEFYERGIIYMSAQKHGYVGAVRLQDNSLDLAGAFDLDFLREAGSPARAATLIMQQSGMPIAETFVKAAWHGTPPLTRVRTRKAAERVFVIGDAASYAEPLTGEGISWALLSAAAVLPFAVKSLKRWSPDLVPEWEREFRTMVSHRQSNSAKLAKLLRSPILTELVVQALRLPFASALLMNYMDRPSRQWRLSVEASPALEEVLR
jgi:2-polyprenyl-6-methoxyphenol hydroxylase-like FAD-dependent oxidoreductase